ncbi:MAG: hypothetical protein R6W06_10360 [Prochlorococcaceae cyanobacterium]
MRPRTRILSLAAAGALCLAAVGCQESPRKAEVDVCAKLARVGDALEQAAALRPSSSVGEAEAAGKELQKSLKALNSSEAKLEKIRLDAFQVQAKAFRKDVASVAKDKAMTLEAAASALKSKAQPVIAAHKELQAGVNCPGAPASKP